MKKIFFILLTLAAFIGYAQNNQHKILYDNNGKVLLNSAGTQVLSTEEGAVDGYNYTPNPEWIPVHGVADNEIWILAFNNGDRYSSFTCTVGSSADYAMDIIGGADGKTLLQTIDTASGKPINFRIPATGGKWCSSEGYYTFKLRIYAVNPTNNILTFTVSKHPLTTTTYNRWKIINFGTKSLTDIQVGNVTSVKCENLLYVNSYYCIGISGYYGFADCVNLTDITMPKTMDLVTELKSSYIDPFSGSFAKCVRLKNISLPLSMNNLLYLGSRNPTADGAFKGCTSLESIKFAPNSLNNLIVFGGRGSFYNSQDYGAFHGCTSLKTVVLPENLNNVIYFGGTNHNNSIQSGAFKGCVSLTSITGAKNMTSLVYLYETYSNCSLLKNIPQTIFNKNVLFKSNGLISIDTFQNNTLKVFDFILTGTSNTIRSNITYINIDWANSNFGGTGNVDIRFNSLSATELDRIFTALPTVTGTHTINVASNIGAATCTTSIATNKGWTVIIL